MWEIKNTTAFLKDHNMQRNIVMHLDHGLELRSNFAGMDCCQEALTRGVHHFCKVIEYPVPEHALRFRSTCDVGDLQSRVLTGLSHLRGGCTCHFRNYFGRLSTEHQALLHTGMKFQDDEEWEYETKLHQMKLVAQWVESAGSALFDKNRKQWCDVHQQDCSLYTTYSDAMGADDVSEKPMQLSSNGVQCIAFSSVGEREGESHTSDAILSVCVEERKWLEESNLEDGFFVECVPALPWKERLAAPLQPRIEVFGIAHGPEDNQQQKQRQQRQQQQQKQ